ncbi:MAG: DUF1016 family protein [Lachnospiraceae bacterium]|nr:DUF1016 family protein [Lachnospiraceae bacterium]
MTFDRLVQNVEKVHDVTTSTAKAAVNQMLTIRNWAIGYYIVEFEQNGKDRSEYGSHLLENLSQRLNIKGLGRLQLNLCRIFYQKYPQICSTASNKLKSIGGIKELPMITENVTGDEICSTASNKFQTDPEMLISRLSFSHIREIMAIDDPFERFFYEFECMRGTWSVKELRRQISTNLYFRAGVSKKPELLLEKIEQSDLATVMTVKEPFALEFLGLNANMAIDENDLENALMDHLQEFLLELGKGFCFEARQKRILIDDEYFFIDLVFYNRILHCNVIIELKDEKFTHENFGQLNSYVAYYKENEMNPGDNPPVGILLCTQKGPKMVEYALSGMDNQLFVSTYMLQLPDKDQLKEFLIEQMEEMGK